MFGEIGKKPSATAIKAHIIVRESPIYHIKQGEKALTQSQVQDFGCGKVILVAKKGKWGPERGNEKKESKWTLLRGMHKAAKGKDFPSRDCPYMAKRASGRQKAHSKAARKTMIQHMKGKRGYVCTGAVLPLNGSKKSEITQKKQQGQWWRIDDTQKKRKEERGRERSGPAHK